MDATIGHSAERVNGNDPAARKAALEGARQRVSQGALQTANAAEARKADQRQLVRAIIAEAVGANTRISILANENSHDFTYRAINIDTGEVVSEWPPEQFAHFLTQNGASQKLAEEALAGLLVDEQA